MTTLADLARELKQTQPAKCQKCECLEFRWNGKGWEAGCSESKCYLTDVDEPITESKKA